MSLQQLKLLLCTMALVPALSWAGGGHGGGTDVGGGGNVVILPDDSVHLADPYIERPAQEAVHPFTDFRPELKAEIEVIGRLMVRLGAAVDESIDAKALGRNPSDEEKRQARVSRYVSRDAQAKFIAMNVESPVTEYVFVKEFPDSCKPVGDVGPVPDGYRVVEIGCTQGPTTYFIKDAFLKLSVREQALSVIHERMHGLIRDFPHHFVTDVTQGLGILLDLANQQRAGKRPVLTDSQRNFLKGTLKAIGVTGLAEGVPGSEWEFWQNWEVAAGGGIYHQSAQLDPTAYVGVGSMLGEGGSLGANAALINSTCYLVACELHEGASVIDTIIAPKISNKEFDFDPRQFLAIIGKRASVSGSSSLLASLVSSTGERIVIGDDVKVEHTDLSGFSALKVDAGASLTNLGIVFTPMNHFSIRFEVGSLAAIQNLRTPLFAGNLRATEDSEIVVTVSTSRRLDFKNNPDDPNSPNKPICADASQWLLLQKSLIVENEDNLRGQCRVNF